MVCLVMALHPRGVIVPKGLVREDMCPLEHLVALRCSQEVDWSLRKLEDETIFAHN
jgi:hypothetical protein